jgi:hypothetical protein
MTPDSDLPSTAGDPPGAPEPGYEAVGPFELLLAESDAVITEWRELVRTEPWMTLPRTRLLDALPEILPKLIRLARAGAHHVDEELKSQITDDHGFVRRQDALPLLAVAEEWSYLKRACVNHLRRRGFLNGDIDRVMQRLEGLIDDAVAYSLRGYYRPELDALRGRGLERRETAGDRRRGGDRRARD